MRDSRPCFARPRVGRSLQPHACMVARHILMQQLDGELARAYSFDRPDLSFSLYRLGLALRLPLPWAPGLNRQTTSISCCCNNHSLPHGSSFLLSSPLTFRARAAADLAKCRASHIRNPSELHAANRTSVPSRSVQDGSRV